MRYDPIDQYKQQAVSTMSKGEQLVLLFDEALKNLRYGSMMLTNKNYPAASKCMDKSKKIFSYLSLILDYNYNVSQDLYKLYYFINQEIIKAEIRQDASVLDSIIPLVDNMRSTWVEAEKLSRIHQAADN